MATIAPTIRVDAAIERAFAYLFTQAEGDFGEVRHEMNFSHVAGFTGVTEKQSSDIFARATLANILIDVAGLVQKAESVAIRNLARHEAEYVAGAKLLRRSGGWSYFPDLPELPPDADSLAAALSLFVRVAPEHLGLCREPVELVLSTANADGSFETWIVGPEDASFDRGRLQWAIQSFWGTGADPDVMAHFYYALWLWAPDRYEHAIRKGASRLMEMQQPEGSWRATWYVGPAYTTGLVLRLLRKLRMGEYARLRSCQFLLDTQAADGTWGLGHSVSLQTALSMFALIEVQAGSPWLAMARLAMARGAAALMERQLTDGSWPPSPWIQMEIGRATGTTLHVATYQSSILTTAFCLRALLLANA